MATVTQRAIVWNTTAGAKTTASFQPAAGELLIAVVGIGGSDTAPTMSDTDSSITGWTLVDSFRSYGSAVTGGLRIYVSDQGASGSSITVTMTPSGDAGGGLAVLSCTNPAAFGASAVRGNGGQADQAAGTPAPVLDATPFGSNPVIVAIMTNTNGSANASPRTATTPDYSEVYDQGFNTPPSGLEVQKIDAGETSATLTTGGATPSGFAAIGIEIQVTQSVAGGVGTENDSPPSGKVQQLYPATGLAAESDAAVAGKVLQLYIQAGTTGVAESNFATVGSPGAGIGRDFDDVDDYIDASIGSAGITTGGLTLAALFRLKATSETQPIFGIYNASNQPQAALEVNSSNQPATRIANTIRTSESGLPQGAVFTADQWVVVAVTKATGTAEPAFHVFKAGTWDHTGSFADLTVTDPGASTYVRFARLAATTTYADMVLGICGIWNANMSNAEVEALATNRDVSDWTGHSIAAAGLWVFGQDDVGDPITDATGNGADQTAITGTSVAPGPIDSSGAIWNLELAGPQTVSGGVALESDSAPAGTVMNTYFAGLAQENDSTTAATLSIGFFRRFDGVDDRMNITNGESLLWDNLTMAAVVRKQRDDQEEWVIYNVGIGGDPRIGIGFNASNQITMKYPFAGTVRKTTTNTVEISDGWVIVAVTKAGGTTTPRAHVWKQDTGWAHEDMDGTLGNPATQMDGYVEMASQGFIGGFSQIDLSTAGEWQQNLSDAEVEELSADWGTLDWFDHSVAVPCGLWNFNQATAIIPTDLSGGEAGPIGLIEGTTVGSGLPVRESDDKVWDPFTPLVGEKAHESDSPSTNNPLAGKVLQTYTASPALESDSAVGGSVSQGGAQTISGGVARENDSGPAGLVRQTYTAAAAAESDTAPSGAVRHTYLAGRALESDTAPAGSVRQTYTAAAAAESDSAPSGKVLQRYTASPAPESDTAPVGKVAQRYTAPPAAESDSALVGLVRQTYAGTQARENDSAPAGKVLQRYTAAPATEADSAITGAVQQGDVQTIAGGVARESDSAPAAAVKQAQLIAGGVAREDDVARGGTISQPQAPVAGSRAHEGDSALGGSIIQPQLVAGGRATESDLVPAGQIINLYFAGTAAEAETVLAGLVRQFYTAGAPGEVDTAPAGTKLGGGVAFGPAPPWPRGASRRSPASAGSPGTLDV